MQRPDHDIISNIGRDATTLERQTPRFALKDRRDSDAFELHEVGQALDKPKRITASAASIRSATPMRIPAIFFDAPVADTGQI
ncbi:MAG: hypothetical protein AAFX06_28690 [Planctomycetota bacterium]